MSHDVNRSQEQDPASSEPLLTPEPTFTHANIAEAYREGLFGSRLDAELADIFASCHIEEEKPQQQGTIALTDKGIESLSCIAIIQGGQIIPVIDSVCARRRWAAWSDTASSSARIASAARRLAIHSR